MNIEVKQIMCASSYVPIHILLDQESITCSTSRWHASHLQSSRNRTASPWIRRSRSEACRSQGPARQRAHPQAQAMVHNGRMDSTETWAKRFQVRRFHQTTTDNRCCVQLRGIRCESSIAWQNERIQVRKNMITK